MYYFPINPKFASKKLISYFNCDALPPKQYSNFKNWGYPIKREKNGPIDFPLLYNIGEIIKANIYNIENNFKIDIPNINFILLVTSSRKIFKLDPNIPMYIKLFPIIGGAVYFIKDGIVNIFYIATHPLIKGGGTILLNYFKKKYKTITLDSLRESEKFYIKNGFRRCLPNNRNHYKEFVWSNNGYFL
jgi:hypothetical protein